MNNPYFNSLEPIWENPKFVFVDEGRLKEVAKDFAGEDLKTPNWRAPVYPESDDELFIDFLGLVDSINFCFTDMITKEKHELEWKNMKCHGSFAMVACLKRALEEGIPILDYQWLKNATLDDLSYIFRATHLIPLLRERKEIFNEVGRVLEEKYGGHFYNLFEEANYRAFTSDRKGIVDRLIRDFPSFFDVSWHEKSQTFLQFHKRAQLYAIMYQGRALDSKGKLSLIEDADNLGPPADYDVPRALKKLGILEYEKSLEKKIKAQKIIKKDSLAEQEIRAQMTYAMVELIEEINKIREANNWQKPKVNILEVDFRVWWAGKEMGTDEPHHLTPTIAY